MAYTVRKVAAISGVSVRTLHFYDEMGLLKPAHLGANGYRFYEEPQLLLLQQILFYRELGFELKQIKRILSRTGFEKASALKSHRKILQQKLARTHQLIETIDRTIEHLKNNTKMKSEDMFAGFTIHAGKDRFGENIKLGGEPNDCKVSGRDTGGTLSVFEFTGSGSGPRHLHHEQDEWIYVIEGDLEFEVAGRRFRSGPGECIFIPRKVEHGWIRVSATPGKIIDVYQPAGKMEEFFRALGKFDGSPAVHEALSFQELQRFFQEHGMEMCGPPMAGEWKVDEKGRIVRTA